MAGDEHGAADIQIRLEACKTFCDDIVSSVYTHNLASFYATEWSKFAGLQMDKEDYGAAILFLTWP